MLPRDVLHVRIADKIWMAFMRGEFDVAVFQAMTTVEVSVRDAAGLGNNLITVACSTALPEKLKLAVAELPSTVVASNMSLTRFSMPVKSSALSKNL